MTSNNEGLPCKSILTKHTQMSSVHFLGVITRLWHEAGNLSTKVLPCFQRHRIGPTKSSGMTMIWYALSDFNHDGGTFYVVFTKRDPYLELCIPCIIVMPWLLCAYACIFIHVCSNNIVDVMLYYVPIIYFYCIFLYLLLYFLISNDWINMFS